MENNNKATVSVSEWRAGDGDGEDGAHGKQTAKIRKSFSFAHENCFKVPFDTHFSVFFCVWRQVKSKVKLMESPWARKIEVKFN